MFNEEKIVLKVNNARLDGYEGSFLREYDENGNALISGLWDSWYVADAVDSDLNDYLVYWSVNCDWYHPFMVLDDDFKNVKDKVILCLE